MAGTWRGSAGAGLVGAVVGAVIGWVLSLTQGPHPTRWPWVVVGAAFGAGVLLLLWERVYVKRHPKPDGRAAIDPVKLASINPVTGKTEVFAAGPGVITGATPFLRPDGTWGVHTGTHAGGITTGGAAPAADSAEEADADD